MRFAVLIAGLVLIAGPTVARQPETLRGPAVKDKAAKATLVQRDFKGKLKRTEIPPEEAAVELLGLDAETKAKVDGVLAARAKVLDPLVVDNVELVVRFYNARQAGNRRDQLTILTELMKKLQPLNARGRLADEIRGALPKDQTQKFDAILLEYRTAATDEAAADAKTHNEFVSARTLETRENLVSLGLEIKRSYEQQVSSKAAEMDRVITQLGLKTEQEAKIRKMVTDFAQQSKGRPSPEQKRSLFFQIMAELNPEQQQRLVSLYLGRADPGL